MATITPAERERRYRAMFDAFVLLRGLDIEFDDWSADDEIAWDAKVSAFNKRYPVQKSA